MCWVFPEWPRLCWRAERSHSLSVVFLQSTEALEFMKRDLAEFTQVVQHDTACTIAATASVVKDKLAVSVGASALGFLWQKAKRGVDRICLPPRAGSSEQTPASNHELQVSDFLPSAGLVPSTVWDFLAVAVRKLWRRVETSSCAFSLPACCVVGYWQSGCIVTSDLCAAAAVTVQSPNLAQSFPAPPKAWAQFPTNLPAPLPPEAASAGHHALLAQPWPHSCLVSSSLKGEKSSFLKGTCPGRAEACPAAAGTVTYPVLLFVFKRAEGSSGATEKVRKGLSDFLGVISDTFAPSPDKTIDCDVITLMATPTGTTEPYDSAKVSAPFLEPLCGMWSPEPCPLGALLLPLR